MCDENVLILTKSEVLTLLADRESQITRIVQRAYEAHGEGDSSLPHATFLRFPNDPANRMISLPAYLGSAFVIAGIKWIASFPGNVGMGLDRASGVVILNCPFTGRTKAILEGSSISTKRTAASASLAALYLHGATEIASIGIIGCGVINREIVRFLRVAFPAISTITAFDQNPHRANHFAAALQTPGDQVRVTVSREARSILRDSQLISIATTATRPYIDDLAYCRPGSTILNVSLRDITPEALLYCENVVDDIDHVCRAQTSVHLAEQMVGNRDFIRCSLADVMTGKRPPRGDPDRVVVFSPFGLGILDIAVGQLVLQLGLRQRVGTVITRFSGHN